MPDQHASPGSSLHPWTRHVFRPDRLAKYAFLIGLVTFYPYVVQQLPDLNSRPEYRLSTKNIQLVPALERPVPMNLLEQIRSQSHLPREVSILDPRTNATIAAAVARHPWIAAVDSVKRTYPAGIEVHVQYRRAAAMVQVKGGRVPIDVEGNILPGEDFSVADVSQFPLIRLIGAGNLSPQGNQLPEIGLRGAVQLAELLAPKWSSLGIEAIELPKLRDGQSTDNVQLRLQTKAGSSILWGRPPGTDHPGELTGPQKIARLEKYLAEFGSFDRPSGPYEIDIRHWQEITRKPAIKPQTALRSRR